MKNLLLTCISILCFSQLGLTQLAPDFTVTSTDGTVHHLYSDYLNQGKVVMIELMFVDCPPCNSVAGQVQSKYVAFGEGADNVQFISLSIRANDSNEDVAGFEALHSLTFPGVGADGGSLSAVTPYKDGTFGTYYGTPTFIVVSPDGSVNYGLDLSEIDIAIENALAGGTYHVGISGYVRELDNETPINGTIVSLPAFGLIDTINSFGYFNFQIDGTGARPDSILVELGHIEDNPVDGVTALDLVLIQKAILNIKPFTHVLEQLAADANASGTVTSADLVVLKKLILNKIQDFDPDVANYNYTVEGLIFGGLGGPYFEINKGWVQIGANNQGTRNFNGIKTGDIK